MSPNQQAQAPREPRPRHTTAPRHARATPRPRHTTAPRHARAHARTETEEWTESPPPSASAGRGGESGARWAAEHARGWRGHAQGSGGYRRRHARDRRRVRAGRAQYAITVEKADHIPGSGARFAGWRSIGAALEDAQGAQVGEGRPRQLQKRHDEGLAGGRHGNGTGWRGGAAKGCGWLWKGAKGGAKNERGSYTTKPRKPVRLVRGVRASEFCRVGTPKTNLLATVVACRLQGLYSTSWAWWPVLKNCREGRWERAL